MQNAKQEFLSDFTGLTVECASLRFEVWELDDKVVVLKVGYSNADYDLFLAALDVTYDDGFGGQELYGIVVY